MPTAISDDDQAEGYRVEHYFVAYPYHKPLRERDHLIFRDKNEGRVIEDAGKVNLETGIVFVIEEVEVKHKIIGRL